MGVEVKEGGREGRGERREAGREGKQRGGRQGGNRRERGGRQGGKGRGGGRARYIEACPSTRQPYPTFWPNM